MVTSVLAGAPGAASLVAGRSLPVRLVKLVRDYGAVIAVAGAVVALAPGATPALMAALSLVNGGRTVEHDLFAGLRCQFAPPRMAYTMQRPVAQQPVAMYA